MNLFQLILKQMRQRSLSTWLTLLSVLLGVALAIAIMIVRREGAAMFGQTDYGYDILVAARGSPIQVVLNTVYQIDRSRGYVPYAMYEDLARPQHPQVKIAIPYAVGDSYMGQRIIGTSPRLFGVDDAGNPLPPDKVMEYRPGRKYEFAQGNVFAAKRFQAVIGADIPRLTGLKLGDTFQATHGLPAPKQTPDIHEEQWEVVGVLKPTRTAVDRVIFIPLTSFYAIFEHGEAFESFETLRAGQDPNSKPDSVTTRSAKVEEHDHDHESATSAAKPQAATAAVTTPATQEAHDAHEESPDHDHDKHYTLAPDGTINITMPKDQWLVSSILVKSRSPFFGQSLMWAINNAGTEAMAVNPASEMREFFRNFLDNTTKLLLLISLLVTIVAAVSILVSIYNSVSARMREIAILRALGATRLRILGLICIEAALIGLIGGLLGLLGGHLLAAAGSVYMDRFVGESINWMAVDRYEWAYLGIVVAIALLAGLVPALKAYRSPVATNLVAG